MDETFVCSCEETHFYIFIDDNNNMVARCNNCYAQYMVQQQILYKQTFCKDTHRYGPWEKIE